MVEKIQMFSVCVQNAALDAITIAAEENVLTALRNKAAAHCLPFIPSL